MVARGLLPGLLSAIPRAVTSVALVAGESLAAPLAHPLDQRRVDVLLDRVGAMPSPTRLRTVPFSCLGADVNPTMLLDGQADQIGEVVVDPVLVEMVDMMPLRHGSVRFLPDHSVKCVPVPPLVVATDSVVAPSVMLNAVHASSIHAFGFTVDRGASI